VCDEFDMKVPVERVGPVLSEVAKLCGKTVDRVPSASTVNRIVNSKLAVSQKTKNKSVVC